MTDAMTADRLGVNIVQEAALRSGVNVIVCIVTDGTVDEGVVSVIVACVGEFLLFWAVLEVLIEAVSELLMTDVVIALDGVADDGSVDGGPGSC
jgi:hypothetical protein